jgi:hypothetical protein
MKTMVQKLEDRLEGNFQSLGAPRYDMAKRMGLQGPTLHTAALDAIIGPSSGTTPTLLGALHKQINILPL